MTSLSRISLFVALAFFLSFGAVHTLVFAQADGSVAPGGACTSDDQCFNANGNSYGCFPEGGGVCTVDGDAQGDGTVPPGGPCSADIECQDPSPTQSYGCFNGLCTPDGDAPTPAGGSPSPAGGSPNPAGGSPSSAGGSLTPPPGATSGGAILNPLNVSSLQDLLNEILGYIVGLATIALVVMLVYVGFLFVAARGNSEKISQARQMLMWTVIGGLLILGAQAIELVILQTIKGI